MKTLIKSAIVALGIVGAAAIGSANAAVGFYVGPGGAHVEYSQGTYYDRAHHRHFYRYPRDWATYHHPQAWYRTHPNWYRDRDWYRR